MISVTHDRTGALVISPSGDLCISTLAPFQQCLESVPACGHPDVVIDLRDVTLLSACAIGVIAPLSVQLDARGSRLRLRRPRPQVARVLAVTELAHLIEGEQTPTPRPRYRPLRQTG